MIIAYVNENTMAELATLETDMDLSPKANHRKKIDNSMFYCTSR